jgi:FkbM family methyltransferase
MILTLKNALRDWIKPDGLSRIKLRPGDIAIDCGANVGLVTHRMARRGVTVYAFEPNPHAFAVLQDRFRHNPAVHCIRKAVLDRVSTVKLYLHEHARADPVKWSVGSSLYAEKANVSADFIEVETIDLAAFILDLNAPVQVVKLDVEGAEYLILDRLIASGALGRVRHLLLETHENKMPFLAEAAAATRSRLAQQHTTQINWDWI